MNKLKPFFYYTAEYWNREADFATVTIRSNSIKGAKKKANLLRISMQVLSIIPQSRIKVTVKRSYNES